MPARQVSGTTSVKLFLNPLYIDTKEAENAETARRRVLRGHDLREHFLPKARGMEPGEDGWFFSGRQSVTRSILEHLADADAGRALCLLTGSGGTGKSAIIGRLAALSDEQARDRALADGWNRADDVVAGTVPAPDFFDAVIHLRGLTDDGLVAAIAEVMSLASQEVDVGMLADLVDYSTGRRPILAVDALDESSTPQAIVNGVLGRLANAGWKILVGSRPTAESRGLADVAAALRPSLTLVLGDDDQAGTDIVHYIVSRLTMTAESPYYGRSADDEDIAAIARTIANRAGGRFLYGRMAASSLVRRSSPLDLSAGWEDQELGEGLSGIFLNDLASFDAAFRDEFHTEVDGASILLAALAFGAGHGLPLWDDIWPLVATAVAGGEEPLTRDQAMWTLATAGRYIIEASESEEAVYRLYHQSLVDIFEARYDVEAVNGRIFDALEALAGSPGSSIGSSHVRRYLSHYATAGGRLHSLMSTAWLLASLEPFASHLPTQPDGGGAASAIEIYRSVAHRIGPDADINAAHLQLAAALRGAGELSQAMCDVQHDPPYTFEWHHYEQVRPTPFILRDAGRSAHFAAWHPTDELIALLEWQGVLRVVDVKDGALARPEADLELADPTAIAWGKPGGEPTLAVAGQRDDTALIILIDELSEMVEIPMPTTSPVRDMVWALVDGKYCLLVGAENGLWILDPPTRQFERRLAPEIDDVAGLAVGELDGQTTVALATGQALWLWTEGELRHLIALETARRPRLGSSDRVTIVFFEADGRTLLAVLTTTERRVLDAMSGRVVSELRLDRRFNNEPSAGLQLDDARPLLALGSGSGPIVIWDPIAGDEIGVLEGHEYPVRSLLSGWRAEEQVLVSAGDRTRLWSFSTNELAVGSVRPPSVGSLTFVGNNGEHLAAGAGTSFQHRDSTGVVRLFDGRDGTELATTEEIFDDVIFSIAAVDVDDDGLVIVRRSGIELRSSTDLSLLDTIDADWVGSPRDAMRSVLEAGVHLRPGSRLNESVFIDGERPRLAVPGGDQLQLVAIDDGTVLAEIAMPGQQDLRHVALCPTEPEPLLATAGISGTITLRSLHDLAPVGDQLVADRALWNLVTATIAGRPTLASGGLKGVTLVWDLATGRSMALDLDHRVKALAMDDAGYLAIGTERGVVTIKLTEGWYRSRSDPSD